MSGETTSGSHDQATESRGMLLTAGIRLHISQGRVATVLRRGGQNQK